MQTPCRQSGEVFRNCGPFADEVEKISAAADSLLTKWRGFPLLRTSCRQSGEAIVRERRLANEVEKLTALGNYHFIQDCHHSNPNGTAAVEQPLWNGRITVRRPPEFIPMYQ